MDGISSMSDPGIALPPDKTFCIVSVNSNRTSRDHNASTKASYMSVIEGSVNGGANSEPSQPKCVKMHSAPPKAWPKRLTAEAKLASRTTLADSTCPSCAPSLAALSFSPFSSSSLAVSPFSADFEGTSPCWTSGSIVRTFATATNTWTNAFTVSSPAALETPSRKSTSGLNLVRNAWKFGSSCGRPSNYSSSRAASIQRLPSPSRAGRPEASARSG